MLEIRRDGPRQTEKHRYGVIDLHLTAGEALRLSVRASAAADAPQVRIGLNYSFGTKKYCHQIRKSHGIFIFFSEILNEF